MEQGGWVSLHRKILESEIYKTEKLFKLAVTLLLLANHEDKKWNGILIKRGSFITGREALARLTHIHESSVYRNLKKLEKIGFCDIKANNEFSIISIVKYDQYQQVANSKANNERTTSEQRANTTNNDNNDNNVIKKTATINYLKSEECLNELSKQFPNLELKGIKGKLEDLIDYCESHGRRYKNYLAFARNAVRKDQNNLPKKQIVNQPKVYPELTEAQRKKNEKELEKIRKKFKIKDME